MNLADKRLILCVGKGGVGRSTVAAAIAGELARSGKKVLLFEMNANDRFGNYFDKPPVGTDVTPLAPNLSVAPQRVAGLDELRGVRRERRRVAGDVDDALWIRLDDAAHDFSDRPARGGSTTTTSGRPAFSASSRSASRTSPA